MSYTSGPWEARYSIKNNYWFIDHKVAEEDLTLTRLDCNKNNAFLIAAAPELLQALKSLIQFLPDDPDSYEDRSLYRQIKDAVKKAKSIITKATGDDYGTLL